MDVTFKEVAITANVIDRLKRGFEKSFEAMCIDDSLVSVHIIGIGIRVV